MTTVDEVKTLFPSLDESDCFGCGLAYTSLIEKLCASVDLNVSDGDYQGTSHLLLRDDAGRPGYLTYGWGSCSGCDAMQACDNAASVAELFDRLRDSVQWFADDAEAKVWFSAHDWKGEFSWHDGIGPFIEAINTKYGLSIEGPKE